MTILSNHFEFWSAFSEEIYIAAINLASGDNVLTDQNRF